MTLVLRNITEIIISNWNHKSSPALLPKDRNYSKESNNIKSYNPRFKRGPVFDRGAVVLECSKVLYFLNNTMRIDVLYDIYDNL